MTKRIEGLRTQIGQFVMVPLWVMLRVRLVIDDGKKDADAAARAIHLYAWLGAKYANRELRAWPKREQLAADLDVSVASLARSLRVLRSAGALKTERRHRADGAVLGLEYILVQLEPSESIHQVQPEPKGKPIHQVHADLKGVNDHQVQPEPKDQGLLIQLDTAFLSTGIPVVKEEPDPLNQIQRDLSAAPPDRSGHPLEPASETGTLLDAYQAAFVARFTDLKPHIVGGRDGKLLKDLATVHGDDHVRRMLEWFFRTPDAFINNTSHDVTVFFACFGKLQRTYREPPNAFTKQHTVMQALKERSDARDRALEQAARDLLPTVLFVWRERLRQDVIAGFHRDYPGLQLQMVPERFEASVTAAMVLRLVDQARRLSPPVEDPRAAIAAGAEELFTELDAATQRAS